ncbi:hypothetical protein [Thioclava sp.]|uniref:hypothetical protein n=1 Tax=Thioclava sp. TaxID=1933450 RepID=UPI003AA7CEE1
MRSVFIIDPDKKLRLTMIYPMNVGRNFDEILRVIGALLTADANKVALPANCRPGDEAIIPPNVTGEQAKGMFPYGTTRDLCCTLWTDMRASAGTLEENAAEAARIMNDYRYIRVAHAGFR